MPYVKGVDRNQTTLFPESIEDYITSDNQVRVIDAYVEQRGMYPYFFYDVQAIGLGATILWLVALIAIFSLIGLILVWIDSLKLPCRLAAGMRV